MAMSKNLVHFSTIVLLSVLFSMTSLISQDCSQTAGSIAFSGSDQNNITTSIFNEIGLNNDVTFVIDVTAPDQGTHTLLILDSTDVILNMLNLDESDCQDRFVFGDSFLPNPLDNQRYSLQLISVDNLDSDLSFGQSLTDISGCFALSDPLVVNTILFTTILGPFELNSNLDASGFNLFGGSVVVNTVLQVNPQTNLDICTIDSTNRAFSLAGVAGLNQTWVVTTREGELLDTLSDPTFDFASYVDGLDISPELHDLEIFYVSFVGDDDWFTIGNNLRTDICNGPMRSQSETYQFNLIECATTCTDDLLNGEEVFNDQSGFAAGVGNKKYGQLLRSLN